MYIMRRLRLPSFSTVSEPSGDVFVWKDKNPLKLNLPEKAKRVSVGQNHTAIVGESGYALLYSGIFTLMAKINTGNSVNRITPISNLQS